MEIHPNEVPVNPLVDFKKAIKQNDTDEFFRLLDESEHKLTKFYQDKENWALTYMKTLACHVLISSRGASPVCSNGLWTTITANGKQSILANTGRVF